MRIWRVLAMTLMPWVSHSAGVADAHAQNFSPMAHFGETPNKPSSVIPQFDYGDLMEEVSLTFVVSVCLADLEYSSACREGSLLEAAKRLEQIYLDVYAMRRAAGSLRIWFPHAWSEASRFGFSEKLKIVRSWPWQRNCKMGPTIRLPLKWIRRERKAATQPQTSRALRRCENGVKTLPWKRAQERTGLTIGRRGRIHTKREWLFTNLSCWRPRHPMRAERGNGTVHANTRGVVDRVDFGPSSSRARPIVRPAR